MHGSWTKHLHAYDGWYYVSQENKTLKTVLENNFGIAMSQVGLQYKIWIFDKNEFYLNENYIKNIDVNDQSMSVYMKIRKVEMVTDCESSQSYSFNTCVEKFIIKVNMYFRIIYGTAQIHYDFFFRK